MLLSINVKKKNFISDCSSSFSLVENSKITVTSPGYPIYIPLVICEWNITILPEHNASHNTI